ncbi:MAG: hypothetical protein KIG68_07360, partial [Oxalobacter sp.]|nr:hypothetical protein [Oxalobacter sp.]
MSSQSAGAGRTVAFGKGSRASRLKKTAVALLAATAFGGLGGSLAYAADVSGGETRTISDTSTANEKFYLNGSNITFTVGAGGAVYNITGNNTGSVSGNTVVINGGTVTNADTSWIEYHAGSGNWVGKPNLTGGVSTSGAVTGNQVSITDAMLGGNYPTVYGGHSLAGNVSKNSVIVESKNPNLYVYGGSSETGVAGGDTAADGNIVTVKSGEVYYVAGGSSTSGDVKNNKAVIEGGTVHGTVYGGYSAADATGNTVSISGGWVEGSVYGGQSDGDAVTGNTLQLEAAGLSAQEIKNFETVRLAGTLAWNDGATVLKAGKFADNETTDAGKKRASLDIKDAETNLAKATLGQMTLLASDTADDFKTLSLIYSGGTEALSETNLSKVVKTGEETPEATPVNGVTVSSISTHTVSLDAENSYKNVLYAVENTPTKITLGEMAWGKSRNLEGAYTFDNMVPIDATDLTFTGAATTALKKGE